MKKGKIIVTILLLVILFLALEITSEAESITQTKNVANIVIFAKFKDDTKDIFNAKGLYDNWSDIKKMYDRDIELNTTKDRSFKNYIYTISEGKINVQNYFLQESSDESFVTTYTLSNNQNYYTSSDSLVYEIIQAINNSKINLNIGNVKLDNTETGILDNITIVIQGNGTDKSSVIYPHKAVYAGTEKMKGLKVSNYVILPSAALVSDDANHIMVSRERGTIAHEFLHVLGMPDLYSNNSISKPIGTWCIMSSTSTYLQYPLSYLRAEKGWISENYITKSGTYTLNSVSGSGDKKIYIIKTPIKDSEYIVLEYRKKSNNPYDFDYKIPSSGLLMYRVNKNIVDKTNLGGENYIYVYRKGTTNKDIADGDIINAAIIPGKNEVYGNADLSIDYSKDKNILYYSDGSNSGIKISEVKTTSNDDEISFKIEMPDYSKIDFWENVGTVTDNGKEGMDAILYTDKINNVVYSVCIEGKNNSSQVVVRKFNGSNWVQVGNGIANANSGNIISYKGELYLVCIDKNSGYSSCYKLQNNSWNKFQEYSKQYTEKIKFVESNNSLYVMYVEIIGNQKKLIVKDINNKIIVERTSNEFCNPDVYVEDNKVYLAYSNFGTSNSVGAIDIYDITTKKWQTVKKLSEYTNIHIVKKYNNKLYVFMGNSLNIPSLLIYDGITWKEKKISIMQKYMYVSLNIINGAAYVSYHDIVDNGKIKVLKLNESSIEVFDDTLGNEYNYLNMIIDKDNNMYALVKTEGEPNKIIAKRKQTLIKNEEETKPVNPTIAITKITLNKTAVTINKGSTYTLTASITPTNTTQSKTITWLSSNTNVATVDNKGKVTAKAAGTTVITAKTSNGKIATCRVTVVNPTIAITKITLNKTAVTINKGSTYTLTASITPTNTTQSKTITWLSSNTNVATVDNKGKITAKAAGTAIITAKTSNGKTATCRVTILAETAKPMPNISYRTHVQNVGWQAYVKNGKMAGTSGRSLRLEGINIKLENNQYGGEISYQTHVQNIGWQKEVKDNQMSGTSGKALRLEAIRIKLTGEIAKHYDIYYRVHCQNLGWLDWAKNGESAGSAGFSYRLEGIEIKLVSKDSKAPENTKKAFVQSSINYQTHVQNEGWQNIVKDNSTSGTSGKALRLEGIKINLENKLYDGNIEYQTHVQNIGWQKKVKNGEMSGTSGRALRLEAIRINLTGTMAKKYDIYYRVHAQNFGWMGWAKNGASAGTAGYSYRLEAIQICIVEKGGKAPEITTNSFRSK